MGFCFEPKLIIWGLGGWEGNLLTLGRYIGTFPTTSGDFSFQLLSWLFSPFPGFMLDDRFLLPTGLDTGLYFYARGGNPKSLA